MSKNRFKKYSSEVLLVSSLEGSFISQSIKAADIFELKTNKNSINSFFKVWAITPKLFFAS